MARAWPRLRFLPIRWRRRDKMVDEEIVAAGVKNPRVIAAMRATPRHEFVPATERPWPTSTWPCRSANSQTISPPYVVAYMTEQLDPQPDDKVLEIGTGSGYQAAVLSPLVKDVYTIEIVKPLGERAARTLKRLKYANVHTKIGDGYRRLARVRAVRQDHRHLLAGESAAGAGRSSSRKGAG